MKRLGKVVLSLGAIASLFAFASCKGNNETNKDDENGESNLGQTVDPINYSLSSTSYDIDKEYYYSDYNKLHQASDNIDVFENKDSIVYKNVTWEELVYLFEQEGNYLVLFGGSWCHNTRAAAGYINDYANEYGIDTIYNFDFRLDSETRDAHIRETKTSTAKAAEYNYLYGELVSKYITNLNDWVEYKEDSTSALTYVNPSNEDVTVAKAQVPFLFLYNKDNTKDNTGTYTGNDKKFPIVYGFEEMIDRDADGVYSKNYITKEKTYYTEEYKGRLKTIFDYIKNNNVTLSEFSASDYIRKSFNDKSSQTLFTETEKINFNTVSYRELKWLLEQDGNSLILLGGSWCGNTQAVINTINDYAVANDLVVYLYDTKIDTGLTKTSKFGYSKDLNTRASNGPLTYLYTNLIEQYFTNITTLYDVNDGSAGHRIDYVNANGETVSVKKAQVPYLLSYNKDAKDELGISAPITGYYEQMLTLSSARTDYVYKAENYEAYRNGIKNILNAYAEYTDITVSDITPRA